MSNEKTGPLAGKVALVTGGSRGIGAAIAARLAGAGAQVVVNYAGRRDAADQVVADIRAAGGRAVALQADVADGAAVRAMFDRVEEDLGGVDVLVNNAGVMMLSPLAEVPEADVARQIGINLTGVIHCMREAAGRLRPGGRIISLSSSVVATRFETYGVYAATKAAVETLTGVLAKEMRGRAVTVNAVAPGPTATELFLEGKSEALVTQLARANPLERLGRPEDIAATVAFLAGPEGGWINGQTLRANGGMV